jgi:hypothetical protein
MDTYEFSVRYYAEHKNHDRFMHILFICDIFGIGNLYYKNRIQWVPGALSLGVKRPGREADHSPPSSAEVKECVELYLHSSNTSSWRGA